MTSFTVKQLVLLLLQAYFTVLEGILTKVKQVVLLLKAISLQIRETIRCQKAAVPVGWQLAFHTYIVSKNEVHLLHFLHLMALNDHKLE